MYYNINYTVVSLVFLAPFVGYTLAALLNNKIHMTLGQRGITIIAPLCKIASYVVSSVHPPYPVLPIIFMLAGFGCGLEDGAFNAWIGNFAAANESLGILHGCYGIGATIAPLISTAMITKANLPWYTFYYLMVCRPSLVILKSVRSVLFVSPYGRIASSFICRVIAFLSEGSH